MYFYAIAVFDGWYQFQDYSYFWNVKRSMCSLIACTEMDDKNSCGKRLTVKLQQRYTIVKLNLSGTIEMDRGSITLPLMLTQDLYPLNAGNFEFES